MSAEQKLPLARLTPVMEQYYAIKARYPDAILFFHIGDFYETFGADAELVSRELDIVLTSRSKGKDGTPLAGVPLHAAEGYVARLISKGYRVAICDQLEDPKHTKGIVRRDVVRVITPGTVIDSCILSSPHAQYLMALIPDDKENTAGLAFLDVSTGEFFALECPLQERATELFSEVAKYRPSECIVPASIPDRIREHLRGAGITITPCRDDMFSFDCAEAALRDHFHVASLEGYGCQASPDAVRAAGAAIQYAKETQKSALDHIGSLSLRNPSRYLQLDGITLRNLEVFQNIRGREGSTTLVSILDQTETTMGSRRLRTLIARPLLSPDEITARLDAVEYLMKTLLVRSEVQSLLRRCADIERIAGRISYGNAGPRDLVNLRESLSAIPEIKHLFSDVLARKEPAELHQLMEGLQELPGAIALIAQAIAEDPPATIAHGGVIREGYSRDLDEIRQLSHSGKEWILLLQQQERQRTGIKSLKIGYNSIFGYYIEVTKPNLHLVPGHYDRKQTTATGERFTTKELREKEAVIATADERLVALEAELYTLLIASLREYVPDLQRTAQAIATLDVYCSLAGVAETNGYVRPVIDEGLQIQIRDGRHPIVEARMPGGFVPNDTLLDSRGDQILIITGANMAGKSTYMRGVALITLMAQMGSFVPAGYARIGIVDRIFTRVGAFDDLASGQSTFMVEMLELANILNNVTEKSLVILDEIGRGTSTLDGYCIARSVLEFLHGREGFGPRTLFATHFHELVSLDTEQKRVKNYHFAVRDTGKDVIFLRKLIPGATDKSYGIHVAQAAGVPRKVIDRANAILKSAAEGERHPGKKARAYTQILLIDTPEMGKGTHAVLDALNKLDIDAMTPRSALDTLYELKQRLKGPGREEK
jgi:DNA mismatch repair protein MutS